MKLTTSVSITLVTTALAFPLATQADHHMHDQERAGTGAATERMQQQQQPGQPGQPQDPRFVELEHGKGVRFVTGGVGDQEQARLKELYGDFGLMVVNTMKNGAYVADVDVKVRDANGNEIIETTTDGPWLIADLPPGRYTVEASFDGNKQTRRVNIGQGQKRVVMSWAEGAS